MHERSSKSGLFLMELIIVIMFFSLASAITVQLFVKSHNVSRNTMALSKSTLIVQNFAEVFRNSNGNYEKTVSILSDHISNHDSSSFACYFNENWDIQSDSITDGFLIKGIYSENDLIHSLSITALDLKNDIIIYDITVEKYIGLEGTP